MAMSMAHAHTAGAHEHEYVPVTHAEVTVTDGPHDEEAHRPGDARRGGRDGGPHAGEAAHRRRHVRRGEEVMQNWANGDFHLCYISYL